MEQTKKMKCFYWPWCYEDKAAFFDRQSESGWQLSEFSARAAAFTQDTAVRFRYALAMLPGAPGEAEYDAAVRTCAANRWERVASCGVWTCFRKPFDAHLPETAFVLPIREASEDRIEAAFRKRMRALVTVIAVCCVIAAGFAVWGYIRKLRLWQVAFPFGVIVVACMAPFTKMQSWLESKGRLKPEPERKPRKK